jgi:hypothetical protein
MKVSAFLPSQIRGFRYVTNHHYVELEDKEGNVVKLPAKTLLKVACDRSPCGFSFFVESETTFNLPVQCHCGGKLVHAWGSGQLAFVPEGESRFTPPAQTGDIGEAFDQSMSVNKDRS